jgi:hypothetical protein
MPEQTQEFFENDNSYKSWVITPYAQNTLGFLEQNKDLATSNLNPQEIELIFCGDSIINYCDDIPYLDGFKALLFRDLSLIINTAKARSGWFLETVNSTTLKRKDTIEHNKLAQDNFNKQARQ